MGNIITPKSGEFHSYSGADIIATINIPGIGISKTMAELSTLTYSIHREKGQVRALGHANVKGFTNGPRTIAGSLVFTVFDFHVMEYFRDATDKNNTVDPRTTNNFLVDELPPFNITVTFENELGGVSSMSMYDVSIIDEGQTMSTDDMYTENVMSYMARDIDLMHNL